MRVRFGLIGAEWCLSIAVACIRVEPGLLLWDWRTGHMGPWTAAKGGLPARYTQQEPALTAGITSIGTSYLLIHL